MVESLHLVLQREGHVHVGNPGQGADEYHQSSVSVSVYSESHPDMTKTWGLETIRKTRGAYKVVAIGAVVNWSALLTSRALMSERQCKLPWPSRTGPASTVPDETDAK